MWAPRCNAVEVVIEGRRPTPLTIRADGMFELALPGVGPGTRYQYRLDGKQYRPDPASRHQPEGVHGPSVVVDSAGAVSSGPIPPPMAANAPSTPEIFEIEVEASPPTAVKQGRLQGLQERFSFDSFVSGPANEFAFAVARRVASWADGHFNPVVFHGPYGFGKTHLLNALAWEAIRSAPSKRVVYLSAERFTSTDP